MLSRLFGSYKVYLNDDDDYYYSFGPVLAAYSYQAEYSLKETCLSAEMETFHNENPSRCEMKIPALSSMPSCPPTHTYLG